MFGKSWTRFQRATVRVTFLYTVIFLAVLTFHPGSRKQYEAFFNTYQIIPALFAGLCGVIYAKRAKKLNASRRIGYFLIGLACLSSTIGQATWTYYESIRGVEVPSPGWPDAGYVSAYPLLIVGIFLLYGSVPIAGRVRQLLDAAIVTSSVGILSWYFVVHQLWIKSDVTLFAKLVSVAYPIGDIAAIFGAIVLLKSAGRNSALKVSSRFLAIGLVGFTFFDTVYTYLSLHDAYHTGSWCDWAWSFGFISIGYASLTQIWWPPQTANAIHDNDIQTAKSTWQVIAPYAFAFSTFGVVAIHDYSGDHRIDNSTFVYGFVLILLVILRQVVTLMENKHLTDHLEEIVSQRTEQITALHQLTKAINNTLHVDQVVAAAANHTLQALRADTVTIHVIENDDFGAIKTSRVALHFGLDEQTGLLEFLDELPLCTETEVIAFPEHLDGRSEFGGVLRTPIMWQQRPTGTLQVIRYGVAFCQTDTDLLESIAFETGTAVENARSYGAALEAADRDSVTNLYNHRAIHQRLNQEVKRAAKLNRSLALIMMDVNNFKLFNDTYGHPVGDQVLKRVSKALSEVCEAPNILGRYGGDEFIVVLPDADATRALALAECIKERTLQEGFVHAGEDRTVPITLSFGVACFPNDGSSRHELLAIADSNLYAAKNSEHGIMGSTDIQRANRELRGHGSFGVLDAIVTTVDNKDRYTRRHSEDVTEFSLWLAEEMGLSEETMRLIRVGGLLHDVGKIGVPDEILRKPGRLTPDEYDIMKQHPVLGALIVGAIPGMEGILDAVRSHHERWDGGGYPDGYRGEETPLLGRIIAIADAFSAMTTDRPYRKGLDWDSAIKEIESHTGTQFDPALGPIFVKAVRKRRESEEDGTPSETEIQKAA